MRMRRDGHKKAVIGVKVVKNIQSNDLLILFWNLIRLEKIPTCEKASLHAIVSGGRHCECTTHVAIVALAHRLTAIGTRQW